MTVLRHFQPNMRVTFIKWTNRPLMFGAAAVCPTAPELLTKEVQRGWTLTVSRHHGDLLPTVISRWTSAHGDSRSHARWGIGVTVNPPPPHPCLSFALCIQHHSSASPLHLLQASTSIFVFIVFVRTAVFKMMMCSRCTCVSHWMVFEQMVTCTWTCFSCSFVQLPLISPPSLVLSWPYLTTRGRKRPGLPAALLFTTVITDAAAEKFHI